VQGHIVIAGQVGRLMDTGDGSSTTDLQGQGRATCGHVHAGGMRAERWLPGIVRDRLCGPVPLVQNCKASICSSESLR
jgi:hypothetical protein